MKTKKDFDGFTIVELLIGIVVIGILAALVLNSFQGVQVRSRDTKRKTDQNAMSTQLEVYYNDNGGYPIVTAQLNTDTWITTNLKGASLDAFRAPGQNSNTISSTATPTISQYGYTPLQSDGTTACTTAPCAKFTLYYKEEQGSGATRSKNSLN